MLPNSPKLSGRPRTWEKPSHKMEHRIHTAQYQPGAISCSLCLTEKLTILQVDSNLTLNKRTELNGKCGHAKKFKLNRICFRLRCQTTENIKSVKFCLFFKNHLQV